MLVVERASGLDLPWWEVTHTQEQTMFNMFFGEGFVLRTFSLPKELARQMIAACLPVWMASSLSCWAPEPDPARGIHRIVGVREDLALVLEDGPIVHLAGVCVPYPADHELYADLRRSMERSYAGFVWPIKWADAEKKTVWIVNGAHPAVARNFDAVQQGLSIATVDEEAFRRLPSDPVPLPPDLENLRRIARRERRGIWDPKYRNEPWNTPEACGGRRGE